MSIAIAPGGAEWRGAPGGPGSGAGARSSRMGAAALVITCSLSGAAVFFCAGPALVALGLSRGAHELAVFAGFFLAPMLVIVLSGRRAELGGLDRGFFEGVGAYVLLIAPLIPLIPLNRVYFESYRMGAGEAASWAFLTLLQVSTIDFFTRRVVQLELERAWGPGWGLLAGFAAWAGGHVLEYLWLRELMTPPGAALFLGLAGALTGLVYWRTKNALGLMAGHFLLNALVAALSIILLG